MVVKVTNIRKFFHTDANNIETLNRRLSQLVDVDLSTNDCIDKKFYIEQGSIYFLRKISRSSEAADIGKNQISCITSSACDNWPIDCSYFSFKCNPWSFGECCELELGTTIDAFDYTFAKDTKYTKVLGLVIKHQQNVEFLPIMLNKRFPNLKKYWVGKTPVRKISKQNFEKLFKLEELTLYQNKIEAIKSDTFEDLISLKRIMISKLLVSSF